MPAQLFTTSEETKTLLRAHTASSLKIFGATAVTPNNTTDFATPYRALYVGGAGNVSVCTVMGSNAVVFVCPAGVTLEIRGVRVNSTGTTATNIVGLV